MSELAPILLFTYKRLETLKETISALQLNYLAKESELFIFSDAGKFTSDSGTVNAVRSYLKTITGFKRVTIFEAKINKGLASSIIDGVSQLFSQYNQVIVLEDDLKTTPNFLSYMNDCLAHYEHSKTVFSASGYSFNLGIEPGSKEDTYFLNRGWSWGWATWKDRWENVDWQVKDYPYFIVDEIAQKKFAEGGSDLNQMLRKQITGQLDSWAIRWFYHQFKVGGLTIYPLFSKVYNDGFDTDATHTVGSSNRYKPLMDREYKPKFSFPNQISTSQFYQKRFQKKMGLVARINSRLESFFKLTINAIRHARSN